MIAKQSNDEGEIRCEGCGTEITWAPVVKRRRIGIRSAHPDGLHYYCCQDCLDGRGCDCGSRMDLEDERRKAGQGAVETW